MRNSAGFSPAAPAAATLNRELAATLGKRLARARVAQHLTVNEVAARLLMSPRHVNALEQADLTAFFGAPYFVRGLQKYSTLLGVTDLPPDLSEQLIGAELHDHDRAAPPAHRAVSSWLARRRVVGIAGTVVVAAASVVYFVRIMDPRRAVAPVMQTTQPEPLASPPTTPRTSSVATSAAPVPSRAVAGAAGTPSVAVRPPVIAAADAALAATPSASPAAATGEQPAATNEPVAPAAGSAGQIVLRRPTWVFVRYSNNAVVERRLQPGDGMTLTGVPIYVAVGVADGVELTLGGRRVEVKPFVSNGQVRIGREDLATLLAR